MEPEIIVARTRDGVIAAAARGRRGARPRALENAQIRAAGNACVGGHAGTRSGSAAWMRRQHIVQACARWSIRDRAGGGASRWLIRVTTDAGVGRHTIGAIDRLTTTGPVFLFQ
jgi:hypothetical protein